MSALDAESVVISIQFTYDTTLATFEPVQRAAVPDINGIS
jgi:hypothetical protein